MAKKAKEIVITTNSIENYDEWNDGYEEFLEINGIDESSLSLDEYINMTLGEYLKDEIVNLDVCCGDIIAIADLGLWNGRRSAYQVIRSGKVNGIFSAIGKSTELYKFYCDRYDVKATLIHHDGTNFVLFREIKEGVNIQPLLDLIYNQEEIPDGMITRLTRSMKPYIKKIYGLK